MKNNDVYKRNVARLGARIRAMRTRAGVSMADLAATAGITLPTLSRFETGYSPVGLEVMERVCTALRFTLDISACIDVFRQFRRMDLVKRFARIERLYAGVAEPGQRTRAQLDARSLGRLTMRQAAVDQYAAAQQAVSELLAR